MDILSTIDITANNASKSLQLRHEIEKNKQKLEGFKEKELTLKQFTEMDNLEKYIQYQEVLKLRYAKDMKAFLHHENLTNYISEYLIGLVEKDESIQAAFEAYEKNYTELEADEIDQAYKEALNTFVNKEKTDLLNKLQPYMEYIGASPRSMLINLINDKTPKALTAHGMSRFKEYRGEVKRSGSFSAATLLKVKYALG